MPTNALSVDLEEHFQVSNFDRVYARDGWHGQPSRVAASTQRLLSAFADTGQRATFFCLGWVAEQQPALLREIKAAGHEIACHGYAHELVYAIGPDAFRRDLQRARAAIEDACGVRVTGYRAPSYSITERSLWALEILAEEGFEYDSSIFPIRHHRYGIRDFSRSPVRIELANGASIREFPMTTLDVGPLRLPLAGGAYLRFFPPALFRWGLRRLEAAGHPIVLYTHPWEVDPDQPRAPVGALVRINHYLNLHRTEARLRTLLRSFRFAPLSEVLDRLAGAGRLPSQPFGELARAA